MTARDHCNTPIRGYYHSGDIVNFGMTQAPAFCEGCGDPYPWTKEAVKAAQELAAQLDGLNKREREELRDTIPDLVRDTPQTKGAVLRFQKLLAKAGPQATETLRAVLVGVMVEAAKRKVSGP
jgi:hypothetical protein